MVTTLLEKLNSRFRGYEDIEMVTQAALLDPRFKKLAFDGYHVRKLEIAMDQIKAKFCQVTITETENPTTVILLLPFPHHWFEKCLMINAHKLM